MTAEAVELFRKGQQQVGKIDGNVKMFGESGRIWKNLEESGKLMGMIGKNDGKN